MDRIAIDTLEISYRVSNTLAIYNILFIDELEKITAQELAEFRNIGLHTIREIRKALARYGTCLKGDYIANSDNEKRLIEDIPRIIKQIQNEVGELNKRISSLYLTLDKLHLDMSPKSK